MRVVVVVVEGVDRGERGGEVAASGLSGGPSIGVADVAGVLTVVDAPVLAR
jgi:hypothetical protein